MNEGYLCEYVTPKQCREPAIGYAGGPKVQHPLCEEHLKPKYHPPTDKNRLHKEQITNPCMHVTTWQRFGSKPLFVVD